MTPEHAIAALMLLANTALIGLVAAEGVGGSLEGYEPAPFLTLKERINQERLRMAPGGTAPQAVVTPPGKAPGKARGKAPGKAADGFVLAGMSGFSGEPCVALETFIDHMDAGILEAGGTLPRVERDWLLGETSCSISEDAVNLSIRKYRSAWLMAGLQPLSPFRALGKNNR